MKREFKQGDRVLVRNNDLQEWQLRTLDRAGGDRWYPFVDTDDTAWSQCRHIDDFRTGDKVQGSDDGINWEDATYLVEDPNADTATHIVENTTPICTAAYAYVRWHPSMPWAKEESLTLEEKVDKMWEQFKTNKQ